MPRFQSIQRRGSRSDSSSMSLDDTLQNLNSTLDRIANLLQTVEYAVLIVAVALAILMIGAVAVCYYDKYKKYNQIRTDDDDRPSYSKSHYHPSDISNV